MGNTLEPFGAWLLSRGLWTLPIRMQRHSESGLQVAHRLAQQPMIANVHHPGLPQHPQHALAQMRGYGSLFSFETYPIRQEQALAFTDPLKLFRFGPSWGGYESLLPSWPMHEPNAEGKTRWLFRIYVGLENPEDLIRDLAQGLDHLNPE